MKNFTDIHYLIALGLSADDAALFAKKLSQLPLLSPDVTWHEISKNILKPSFPFQLHLALFSMIFPNWKIQLDSAPAFIPDEKLIQKTHLAQWMNELNFSDFNTFHAWSVEHYAEFWQRIIQVLKIVFKTPPKKIVDLPQGVWHPQWLPGAKLNIADSCFTAPLHNTALIYLDQDLKLQKKSYGELNNLSNQVANSLVSQGFLPQDAIAIYMPMTVFAVAIYLGIIKMGGIVVSIADSFSAEEIATRLQLANTKGIFTQDYFVRDTKKISLYQKVIAANAPKAIILPFAVVIEDSLRANDLTWEQFLERKTEFSSVALSPQAYCNILFSSGTTGHPKAIPWDHTTPIKAASDGYFHQDIYAEDVISWPTNLGWMMGPWVIFASFINHATLALYVDVPTNHRFGEFIQNAGVTILGVIPAIVAEWRYHQCMQGLNWQKIRLFSSTGESSNPEDMLFLMSLAEYKPIIEYCGGTEIGGAYITSTLIQPNYLSVFTTPTLGINFVILNEKNEIAETGEVALIPPSIGLSNELLNADHDQIYYADMPHTSDGQILRRHGDAISHLTKGYTILGRIDDTMNLAGIKVSSAEIERVLVGIEGITETAAIAVTPVDVGPSQLIIFAATLHTLPKNEIKKLMQIRINQHLNPLFKIHDIEFIHALPKTASNKIMRRILRKNYQENMKKT